jgi:nucleotide-binding universal stress UspA family protein
MEKILVGVDGSATAEAAAREAAELAKRTGAELHLVSALKRSGTQVVHGGGEQWTISDVDRASSKLQAFAAKLNAGRKVTCAVLDGDPAKAIVAEAERVGADVIVIGNKRVSGAGRVLGAIAIDVVRHAPCSVYIAKTN